MPIPPLVQQWIDLHRQFAKNPSGPAALPVRRVGDRWYFLDARCRELRNIEDAADTIQFETDADLLVFLGQYAFEPPPPVSEATERALDAFWDSIVTDYPEAKTGDLSPLTAHNFDTAAQAAIAEWVDNNCS